VILTQFLQAGVLSLEEQIIDATTEEGQKQLKEMEKQSAEETKYDDPE
jgi:cell division cycle protein 37